MAPNFSATISLSCRIETYKIQERNLHYPHDIHAAKKKYYSKIKNENDTSFTEASSETSTSFFSFGVFRVNLIFFISLDSAMFNVQLRYNSLRDVGGNIFFCLSDSRIRSKQIPSNCNTLTSTFLRTPSEDQRKL